MEAIQSFMERYFVPLAAKINGQRHVAAMRDAFTLSFPLTMGGSMVLLINYVLLDPSGFIAKLLHLGDLIPNLAQYQAVLSSVINGTTNILAILIAFLVAYQLAQEMGGDKVLCGITSLSSFFILYPAAKAFAGKNAGTGLTTTYFGAQGLLVALLVGLLTTELLTRFGRNDKLRIKMPEMVPPAVAQSFNLLIPMMIVLAIMGVLNYLFSMVTPEGIQVVIYNAIHGPNTLSALRSVLFTEQVNANLAYVASHGSAWGCPYPIFFQGINDAFGNTGGSGATLGLIIAMFIAGRKNKGEFSICKMAIGPGLFNINEPIMFGLPIVMNPMYVIPFILAPIVCNYIGYFCVCLKIIPPVAYSVAWTTPGFLIPFLGTGANNIMSLVIGILCLAVSTLIYLPFVVASTRAAVKKEAGENNA